MIICMLYHISAQTTAVTLKTFFHKINFNNSYQKLLPPKAELKIFQSASQLLKTGHPVSP